ncbi:MAG: NUDIX hydrolase [Prevotella sp.]|nr:NUDIX hydrolase [Prevotella sp.]
MSYEYKYPHPAVTADCIVMTRDNQVLLIQRKNEPCQGQWAFPGGFMNIDETAEAAAVRELQEETGITLSETDIFQVGAYTAVDRDPRERVITIAYLAEIDAPVPVKGSDDAARAQWFPLDALPPLAFDHAEILLDAKLIRSDE